MSKYAGRRLSAFEVRKATQDDKSNPNRDHGSKPKDACMSDKKVSKTQNNNSRKNKKSKLSSTDENVEVIDITEDEPNTCKIVDDSGNDLNGGTRTVEPHEKKEIEISDECKGSVESSKTDKDSLTQGQNLKRKLIHENREKSRNKSSNRSDSRARDYSHSYVTNAKHRKLGHFLDKKQRRTQAKLYKRKKEREVATSIDITEVEASESPVICITDSSSEEEMCIEDVYIANEGRSSDEENKSEGSGDQEDSDTKQSDSASLVESKLSGYTLKVAGGVLVILPHPSECVLKGKASLCMVVGKVAVQGYHLQPGKPETIYSPECNSLLTIKTVQSETCVEESVVEVAKLFNLGDSKTQRLKSAMIQHSPFVVVHVKDTGFSFCDIVSKVEPYSRLFEVNDDETELNEALAPQGVTLMPRGDVPNLDVKGELEKVLQLWSKEEEGERPHSILVCGGKDSGKSTTNRLLLNSALNSSEVPVYYLDCDVGQAEFTPAGCVSLVKVTTPLLGPPFCNQRDPVFASCFQGLSPKDDPDRYLACVLQCVERFRLLDTPARLVVNTMGWMSGLGFQLLVDIVNLVQPQYIIQLTSPQKYQNIAPLTRNFLNTTSWSQHSGGDSSELVKRDPRYKPTLLHIEFPVAPGLMSKYRASDHRNFSLLSHLCHNLDPDMTLTSVHPYCIHWKDVAVQVCHKGVPRSQVMYALNGSLVALCRADISKAEGNMEDGPLFFQHLPVCEWLGYGIVRGIEPEKRLLYVTTSIPVDKLDLVNTLVKGSVTIPDLLLLSQRCGELVYVDDPKQSLGASSVKPRRHMPRRSQRPVT